MILSPTTLLSIGTVIFGLGVHWFFKGPTKKAFVVERNINNAFDSTEWLRGHSYYENKTKNELLLSVLKKNKSKNKKDDKDGNE